MSSSKWYKNLSLNLIDGPLNPKPLSPLSPLPEELELLPLRNHILRIHAETVAQMAEENAEFLSDHRRAFRTLAQAAWNPHEAWNYLNRLAAAGGGSRYSSEEIETLARNADYETAARIPDGERAIDAPEGWEGVVLEWRRSGWDADYVQSFAYRLSDLGGLFGPEDLRVGLGQYLELEAVTFEFVPGLEALWNEVEGGEEDGDGDGDVEMGDYLLGEEEEEEGESVGEEYDEEDQDMYDEDANHSDEGDETDDNDFVESSPTTGRFEVVETPAGGRRFLPVTDAQRDDMLQGGEYEESFNQNGTSYMYPATHRTPTPEQQSSLPDYESDPPRSATPARAPAPYAPLREQFPEYFADGTPPHTAHASDSSSGRDSVLERQVDAEIQQRAFLDQYYEEQVTALEERLANGGGEGPDSEDGYIPPPSKLPDDPVRADRPSPPPPGGGGGGAEEFQDPDDGLFIRLRGPPASPAKSSSSRKSSELSSSPLSSPPKSSSLASSSRSGSQSNATREDSSSDDEDDISTAIAQDERSDDDDTEADSEDEYSDDSEDDDSDDGDHDPDATEIQSRYDIHDRLVRQYQASNDLFVTTHKSVFSILAADGWTPYLAWRFVRFLIWSQGGNATIADLINIVSEIHETQLHAEYTLDEERLLVKGFPVGSEMAEIMTSLYRAGFDPQYLQGYLRELEIDGRSAEEIENELEGYEAGDWLWEWVPSMYEIWSDAGETNPVPTQYIVAQLHAVSPTRHSPARSSPQYVSNAGSSPRRPSGSQPYSPSYPPVPASFEYLSSPQGSAGSQSARRSSSSARRSSSMSVASPNIYGPTASELFFRGQNPHHVGAASPQSPHFPSGSSPTSARRSSLARSTPSPSRSSSHTATLSELAVRRRVSGRGSLSRHPSIPSGGSGGTPSSGGNSGHTPSPPAPRAPPNTPSTAQRPPSQGSSGFSPARPSSVSSSRRPSTSDGLARNAPRAPSVTPPRSLPNTPTSSQLSRARNVFGSPSSSAARRALVNLGSPSYRPDESLPHRRSSTPSTRRSSGISSLNLNQTTASPPRANCPAFPAPRFGSEGPIVRPQGILTRPSHVPLVDPLRYINRLSPPRRLVTTPTRSHQPPGPRRHGPRACGECGRPYSDRTTDGRVTKSPSPPAGARKSVSPEIIRKSTSPAPIRKSISPSASPPRTRTAAIKKAAATRTISKVVKKVAVKKSAVKKAAAKKAAVKKSAVKKAAVKKVAVTKAAVKKAAVKKAAVKQPTVRRSGRMIKRPDRL